MKKTKLLNKMYQDLFKNKVRILHGVKVFESDYKKKIESHLVYPNYTCKKCGGEFQTNPPTYTMVGMDLRLCTKCDKKLNKL